MTCHRIGCRVSFFHNHESPICNPHSSNPKGWLTFEWHFFFFPGKRFETFSRVLGQLVGQLLPRQSNRPYIGSSTSLLWSTLDPGTLVCYRTGAHMLLWMDVATMITRVIIAIIRTMMIHSWCKWWGKHLEIFGVHRSSHSIAKMPRCRCHLNSWSCLLFPLVSVLMKDCQPILNRWIDIITNIWNSSCISTPYYLRPAGTLSPMDWPWSVPGV